jgi:hypothetical protein
MESLERARRPLDTLARKVPFPLIASLPQNTSEYAIESQEAGADAIIVGVEKTDSLFPGLFAGFELQEQYILDMISTISIPVGISIGDARPLQEDVWERIVGKEFSFVNMYAHHMPLFVFEDNRIQKLVSIGPGYMLEQIKSLSEMEHVTAVEAALVSAQAKSHPFSLLDLSTLKLISRLFEKSVFLRTQKKIHQTELGMLFENGITGIILDPSILEPGIEAYRDAIKSFRQRGMDTEQGNE